MILGSGNVKGAQVLRPKTVALMSQNHIGALEVGEFKSAIPALSNDIAPIPGISLKWGLSFLINAQQLPTPSWSTEYAQWASKLAILSRRVAEVKIDRYRPRPGAIARLTRNSVPPHVVDASRVTGSHEVEAPPRYDRRSVQCVS
jgi:hypothetical protein